MRNAWTEDELKTIQNNYELLSDKELAELIPNHSEISIMTKRKRMGLHRTNRKYTFEDVVNTCAERDYVLLSTEFTSCANSIDFICKKHNDKGVQHVTYGHMLEGKGCYWCGRERCEQARRDMVPLQKRIDICEQNGLLYVGSNYNDKLLNIEFVCARHSEIGVQTMRYANMKRGIAGCRYCAKEQMCVQSKGEVETERYLQQHQIRYVRQKTYTDCRDVNMLPFDFFLVDHNTVIEFDGEQHYYPVNFHGMAPEDVDKNFLNVQKHDRIKNKYCEDNDITLIRIPYTERGCIDAYLTQQLKVYGIIQ